MKVIQMQTVYGTMGPSQGNGFTAIGKNNNMEYRSIWLIHKLMIDAEDFSIWTLRFEINPVHTTLLELIKRLPSAVVTFEGWCVNYAGALREHSQTEESMLVRMRSDLDECRL